MEFEITSKNQTKIKSQKLIFFTNVAWVVFAILCILISLYPLTFIIRNTKAGFLALKNAALLSSYLWNIGFYMHISFSGIALLIGWFLLIKKYRNKFLNLHKLLGKIYVISVFLGGGAGLFIAFFASGGLMAKVGFSGMAITWLFTTYKAYSSIRKKDIFNHEKWMIRSYAVTFAGVTFRLWLPFLLFVVGLDFLTLYPINAWISWVLNLFVAEIIIYSVFSKRRIVT